MASPAPVAAVIESQPHFSNRGAPRPASTSPERAAKKTSSAGRGKKNLSLTFVKAAAASTAGMATAPNSIAAPPSRAARPGGARLASRLNRSARTGSATAATRASLNMRSLRSPSGPAQNISGRKRSESQAASKRIPSRSSASSARAEPGWDAGAMRASSDISEDFKRRPAERRAGRHVQQVVLLGEERAEADQHRKESGPHPQPGMEIERGQRRDRHVHAGKTVGARVEALNQREEALGTAAPGFFLPPALGRGHGKGDEEGHLENQQQDEAAGDPGELARRPDGPVDVEDHGIIEKAVDPHPAGAVGNPVVGRELQLARRRERVPLAPEIKLVDADDEKNAERQVQDVIGEVHGAASVFSALPSSVGVAARPRAVFLKSSKTACSRQTRPARAAT